jgi:type I restriction enzyme S subunit
VRTLKYLVQGLTVGIVVTPAKYYVKNGVLCLRSLNISGGVISTEQLVFISAESNELHSKSKIHAGDLVIVRTALAGTAVVVPKELEGANCIDLLIIGRSDHFISDYLFYYINCPAARGQVEARSVGAIQCHCNTSTLGDLLIPDLPKSDQREICRFVSHESCGVGISLPDVVRRFKTMTTRKYAEGVKQDSWPPFRGKSWQRNYYEHIVRNDEELSSIREYVLNNPRRWPLDRENPIQATRRK